VIDAAVIKNIVTQKPRGFGFVTFKRLQDVECALANNPHFIKAKQVDTKRSVSREGMKKLRPASAMHPIYPGNHGDFYSSYT
jgi:hypothetical protein